jgi:hypothetical protein
VLKLGVLLGALALAVSAAPAAAVIPPKPVTLRIVVKNYRPVGGLKRFTVKKNKRVLLIVTSNRSEEVHLHGYDIAKDVTPLKPARIFFTAKISGRFEIELEHRGLQIGELTVS